MEIIFFNGEPLPQEAFTAWKRQAAEQGVDLRITSCKTEAQVSKTLAQAIRREKSPGSEYVPFRAVEGDYVLKLSDICYLKGEGHRIKAVLIDGRVLRSKTLRTAADVSLRPFLGLGGFLQARRALFINMEHIDTVLSTGVRLDSGEIVPISTSCRRKWRTACKWKNEQTEA